MPKIEFQNTDRETIEIPTTEEIMSMPRKQLRDTAELFSYALQHGSGAAVRLALPFSYCVAQLIVSGDGKDAVSLVRELEEKGHDSKDEYGTLFVRW